MLIEQNITASLLPLDLNSFHEGLKVNDFLFISTPGHDVVVTGCCKFVGALSF